MKNIFYIVIDAFCYNNLTRKIGEEYTTPFLRELSEKSVFATNMYSQAPYTEASLVALLSGENILENGGYLFGNKFVKKTVFEDFSKAGYEIISQYSPYIYSKAYLKDIDSFFYTRLVSIRVVFDYRLAYYKVKYDERKIKSEEEIICIKILKEEFDTWIQQAELLLIGDKSCYLIQNWIEEKNVREVLEGLVKEKKKFENNEFKYLHKLFENFDNNELLELNKIYNKKSAVINSDILYNEYQKKFEEIQKMYSSIIYKDVPDCRYLFSVLKNNINGYKDFKGLLRNYKAYYTNKFVSGYLKSIDNNTQTEVCMKKQFDYIIKCVNESNLKGIPALAYLQVQDFHLPTAIHSSDYNDLKYIESELDEAISLCGKIDKNYKGNLIADLGARYCDNKLKEFFYKLKDNFGDNFKLIITADHGYPSYYNPPRSVIYNQTFVEAFHIPFILYDGENNCRIDEITSTMDHFEIIKNTKFFKGSRKYILSEYGGPGCPNIGDKPVWYTYIDQDFRVSAELLLSENMGYDKLKGVYRINIDKYEKNNLVKKAKKINEINDIMNIIDRRNKELREKYDGDKFLNYCNNKK